MARLGRFSKSGWGQMSLCVRYVLIFTCVASSLFAQKRISWNGYTQVRFTEKFNDLHSFSIRRTKLWLKGRLLDDSRWNYKIQALYRWQEHGALVLQDAFGEYCVKYFCLRFGQMVPDFSLERSQHDFILPLLERAQIVNALIPSAESGARDIGLQLQMRSENALWIGSFGMFNGEGGNNKGNADDHFLYTTRQQVHFHPYPTIELDFGASVAYRHATGMVFRRIFANDSLFSGDDVRWGVDVCLLGARWSIQGEYIHATLNTDEAYGYYLLAYFRLTSRQLLALQTERFIVPCSVRLDNPTVYNLGYTYFIQSNQAKLMADLRIEHGIENRYTFMVQMQLFFN